MPSTVTPGDVRVAMERIAPHIHRTDVAEVALPDGGTLLVKAESLQTTGSFKARGAFNRMLMLSDDERAHGVIAASAGNHAQGVAKAAKRLGVDCTIVMPKNAPLMKIAAVEGYGAHIILHGEVYDDAYAHAIDLRNATGATFIHPFDDAAIVAGQGTIALEIAQQAPDLEMLLVPVGGGGLAAGVALAMHELMPACKVYGVEPEGAASMLASFKAGRPVTLASAATIADGIAVKTPGDLTYALCREYLKGVVTVDDGEIASAMLYLLERAKIVTEGAGAASFAAALYGRAPIKGRKTMALLSGGNIDSTMIARIIDKGLVKAGRKMSVKVLVLDRPGQLGALLDVVSETGANVVAVSHDRLRADVAIGSTVVELELETRDRAHALLLRTILSERDYRIMA